MVDPITPPSNEDPRDDIARKLEVAIVTVADIRRCTDPELQAVEFDGLESLLLVIQSKYLRRLHGIDGGEA